jgi:hypothetical protein
MTPAAIRSTFEETDLRRERLQRGWSQIGEVDCHEPERLEALRDFLRVHFREPIVFQQTRVLPALLELEPSAEPLVAEARAEHLAILESLGRLFEQLAACLTASEGHGGHCPAADRGRSILEHAIDRLGHTEQRLLPLLLSHRDPLAERLGA